MAEIEAGPPEGSRSVPRSAAELLVLAAVYVVAARAGLLIDAISGFASLVWPATGIALAALLLRGVRLWPGVYLGAVLANLLTGASLPVALGIACGNTLEAVVGALLLRRVFHLHLGLGRLRDPLALLAVAGGGSLISATIGVLSISAAGAVLPGQLARTWSAWWLGDALGALVVAPFLLTWFQPGARFTLRRRQLFELVGLAFVTLGVGYLVFLQASRSEPTAPFQQPYLLFPVLCWGAIRFGPRGATAVTLLLSAIAVRGTVGGSGPFAHESVSLGLFELQAFMAVAAVTALVLAAALAERREALRAREQLLAVVCHDLKNPLNAIRLTTSRLLKQPPEELGAGAGGQVQVIERAAGRMGTVISDLLDVSSIRVGRLALHPEPQDLAELVREAVELIRPLAAQKSQTLQIIVPPKLLVKGDRGRILQVLSNLLGNATKFTPEHGTVTIRAGSSGGFASCVVSDSGPGIDPEQLRHVFEPFWTGDAGRGTGLGLSIVKGIVEAHGGRVWVRSRPGAGLNVTFQLPLEPERLPLRAHLPA